MDRKRESEDRLSIKELLHNIWAFFIDAKDGDCMVCGRPEYLDCIADELCGRAERYYRRQQGDPIELLSEIIDSPYLSDLKGDASGGHLLADARAFLREHPLPAKKNA